MSPPTFKAASMASRRRSKLEYTLGELEGSLDNEKKARTAVEILNLRSRRGSSRATMSWLRMVEQECAKRDLEVKIVNKKRKGELAR